MQRKIFYKFLFIFLFFQQNAFATIFEGIPRVVDGDSLEINDNKIRLTGIDAPEKKQLCKKPFLTVTFLTFQKEYECGAMATERLKKFIKNRSIRCNSESKDRYDRFIATCYLKNKNINSWIVRNGYAVAYTRYSKKYVLDEEYAKKNKLGIWKGTFQKPEEWRKKAR